MTSNLHNLAESQLRKERKQQSLPKIGATSRGKGFAGVKNLSVALNTSHSGSGSMMAIRQVSVRLSSMPAFHAKRLGMATVSDNRAGGESWASSNP